MNSIELNLFSIEGTGPSAIALSYFLSGHVPYWNGCPVSNDILNVKLEEFVKDRSLFDQVRERNEFLRSSHFLVSFISFVKKKDFEFLSEGLEGHSPSPIGLLFDHLMHPDADLGADLQSKLKWRDEPSTAVEHVCLGLTGIGGRWHRLRSEHFQTVTMTNRMELPNYSFSLFRQQRRVDRTRNSQRATYDEVRAYFIHYVKRFGLKNFFRTGCRVTSIERVSSHWQIRGFDENQEKHFFICAKFLVLATGISESITRPLSCLGEETIHSLTYTNPLDIEDLIIRQKKLNEMSQPLLVVGFGPTAIDVILLCDRYSIPILHVFRRSIDDPELILNRYSSCIYPEYDRVRDLIRNSPTSVRNLNN